MHFGISFVINVLKFSDRICSGILFFVSLNGIDFYHLVGALPKNVNSGVVINGHDYSELQFFLVALFVGGKLQTWDFVSLGYFPFFVDFPGMQQFDFLLLEVWSDQSDIVFMGLDVLNYGFELVWLDDFSRLDAENVECGHTEYHCEIVIKLS